MIIYWFYKRELEVIVIILILIKLFSDRIMVQFMFKIIHHFLNILTCPLLKDVHKPDFF